MLIKTTILSLLLLGGVLTETSTSPSSSTDTSNNVDTPSTTAAPVAAPLIKRMWGVADTVATVGRLFYYHIPGDAFSGPVQSYELTAAGSASLPRWLQFNSTTAMLEGVPTEDEVGQHYFTIKALADHAEGEEPSFAKDVFSIEVMPSNHESSSRAKPLKAFSSSDGIKCEPGSSVTLMSVIVDADLQQMSAPDTVAVLTQMAEYLGSDREMLQLLPQAKDSKSLDYSAVLAGPGNAHQKLKPGAVIQWQVGCGGKIEENGKHLVKQIEMASHNGTLAEILKTPVIGWHIAAHSPYLTRREKRQLYFGHSTPVPDLVPNRHTIYPNWPEYNERNPDSFGEESEVVPESRIIPTMASPIFTEATHYPHHHKHRTKTMGRHHHHNGHHHHDNHDDGMHMTVSPAHHQNYRSSQVFGTIIPTPPSFPVWPTQSVGILEPSRTFTEELTVVPDYGLKSSIVTPHLYDPFDTRPTESRSPIPSTPLIPDITRNYPPIIKQRMEKLAFTAGKIHRFRIPENTFYDDEDGDTSQLTLMFRTNDGLEPPIHGWIKFDPITKEIIALPTKENIGTYHFVLEAMDSSSESVTESVDIKVRQYKLDRNVNHAITFHLTFDKHELMTAVDWQIRLVNELKNIFGDRNAQNITVLSAHSSASSGVFVWTNDSLARSSSCPVADIERNMKVLISNDRVSPELVKKLGKFRISEILLNGTGTCEGKFTKPTKAPYINTKPSVRNPIDLINATVGEVLRYKIPGDLFFDEEDGPTLKLVLKDKTQSFLPNSSWILLDESQGALVGLPMTEEESKYFLYAYDKGGEFTICTFVVKVHPRPVNQNFSVEFSIHLEYDFHEFQTHTKTKLNLLYKLAHLYGDEDPRYITVIGIKQGSVIFSWSNNTLPQYPCPKEQITNLVKYLFNDNGTVSQRLITAFAPEFNITKADAMPMSVCLGDITPTSVTMSPVPTIETEHATSDDDIYISTIIPAVVIAAMLLIAAIIACILYRKKRKGKMTMEDNSTFMNKGIPIIFADELEDKPDPAKAPMIMKEEKPPLPPPEYPRTSSGSSSPSTPPTDRKEPSPRHPSSHHSHHHPHHPSAAPATDHSENSPLYQPPPPFTTNRDSRMNRPKHTPTYRMPPPYVPP